ncbi:MAG: type II toxin-antitoxin system RelE/ParE family toxin [Candidatus Hatepunaea meridiana]|nr:type II toxin-antitoxin system RelE/ParE family toxin [Candidatus Hatepunaea meridiana]
MAYIVDISSSARRRLTKLPVQVSFVLIGAFHQLEINPRSHGKKLSGFKDTYQLRVDDYRIVYQVQKQRLIVFVIRIGHRREVYRDM